MLRYLLPARFKTTQVENDRWSAKPKGALPPLQEGGPLSQCHDTRMPVLARLTVADGLYRPRCPEREQLDPGEKKPEWDLHAHPSLPCNRSDGLRQILLTLTSALLSVK
jgi:hypothetical protein